MVERGERFAYLRGNGEPDNSTPQEKLLRMLSVQHPPEEVNIPEAEFPSGQLREVLSNQSDNKYDR